jgi:hypothetical protein
MPNDGMRTVLVALGAGLGVAVAKAAAVAFTGSAAVAASGLKSSSADPTLFALVDQDSAAAHTKCIT